MSGIMDMLVCGFRMRVGDIRGSVIMTIWLNIYIMDMRRNQYIFYLWWNPTPIRESIFESSVSAR